MASRTWSPGSHRWKVATPWDGAGELARRLGTAPLVAQMLANRGVTDTEAGRAFLNPKLSDLHDPTELPGTQVAAERIARAITDKERIVIYGDYDVDGITAVAILHACLRMVGGNVGFYVPHRLEEGYGVNVEAVRKLIADGAEMIITVDCGISAVEPLAEATAAGVEVIVTDHHSPPPPDERPNVSAIVHPQIGDYPNPNLAGAGVAFKLAWQLARAVCGNQRVDEPMRDFLLNATCLAALGTIADVVPLVGENRALATFGLRGLPSSDHPGLKALLASAKLDGEQVSAFHVGFVLAPRINACGRMGHARLAVELLTDADPAHARKIADYLAKQNTARQKVEREITQQAIEMVESQGLAEDGRRTIALCCEQWHGGVIGIVASRLVDRFARPTVLVAVNGDGKGQGSGRSIAGFHMRDALAACSEHLIGFGGHAMAGGVRIEPSQFDAFAEAFEQYGQSHMQQEQLVPTLHIDAEANLSELNLQVASHVERLAPFGQGNPTPLVAVRGCRVLSPPKRMGRNGGTIGLTLGQDSSRIRAVGFGMGDLADLLVGVNTIDIVGQPVLNHFNGSTTVELKLSDVHWD